MAIHIDVTRFLEETTLKESIVARIKERHAYLKTLKGLFSVNDTLGKEISSGMFPEPSSAHFRRWILANHEIGDEE